MNRLLVSWLLIVVLVGAWTRQADAYLKLGASLGGQIVSLQWAQQPIRYFVTNRGVPGVSATQLRTAVDRAAQSWQNVPSSAVSFVSVGFTSAEPFDEDGIVTIGFQNHPELDRVLGTTGFIIDVLSGDILEADIFLNGSFQWSVAADGEAGRFDVESIALHEIGHLAGLSHSLLGETEMTTGRRRVIAAEAVMFPIAFSAGVIAGRTLRADDVAGMSDIYPDGGFRTGTGSVQGRVTRNGSGIFGAHVVAFHPPSGNLVGGFTLSSTGEFIIAGLMPGPHIIRVEPLDDAAIDSFFGESPPPETRFVVTYLDQLAVVPSGGNTEVADIAVRPE
ncbi:MAG: matrixin family metalloprotease [Vicinamibacterales bacterium]